MSEPMWFQGDSIALMNRSYAVQEVECDCGNLQEIDVEEEHKHGDTTWWGEWVCTNCNEHHQSHGWY